MAVKSQAMYFPLAHGTSVAPSGLLPSVLMRPDGSFVQRVSAFVRARHTKSLTAKLSPKKRRFFSRGVEPENLIGPPCRTFFSMRWWALGPGGTVDFEPIRPLTRVEAEPVRPGLATGLLSASMSHQTSRRTGV